VTTPLGAFCVYPCDPTAVLAADPRAVLAPVGGSDPSRRLARLRHGNRVAYPTARAPTGPDRA
jgi:hypothetical protein